MASNTLHLGETYKLVLDKLSQGISLQKIQIQKHKQTLPMQQQHRNIFFVFEVGKKLACAYVVLDNFFL